MESDVMQGGDTVASSISSVSLTATSTQTSTWAKGITLDASGNVTGGYYDVHKVWGGVDNNMCWAASASNIIAWWQDTYSTTDSLSITVPETADDVFDRIKKYWANAGNAADCAFDWWLAGGSTTLSTGSSGGYYSGKYSSSNIGSTSYYCGLVGASAEDTAQMITNILSNGGMISLGVNTYDGVNWNAGHAVTLWGVTTDSSTGHITAIHLTDSDDGYKGIFTVHVQYNEANKCYEALDNRYDDYYMCGVSVLAAYSKTDTTAPSAPTGARTSVNGQYVTFSWDAVSDPNGVVYEVLYQRVDAQYCEISMSTGTSLTVELDASGTYYWWIRTRDGMGNFSGDYYAGSFSCKVTPPSFTFEEPGSTKTAGGKSDVSFVWNSSENLSYELRLDGTLVYSGKDCSYNQNLADGIYSYTITATNSSGYSTTRGGTLVLDTIAPSAPTNLKSTIKGNQVVFSWTGVTDASGVTYTLGYSTATSTSYIWVTNITSTSLTVDLTEEGEYEWVVYASDGVGLISSVVHSSPFVYGMVLDFYEPEPVKTSEGKSSVVFSWSTNGSVTATLSIGGKTYTRTGTSGSVSLTLSDDVYDYTLTVEDGAGNREQRSGTITCDTMAPATPSSLRAQLQQSGSSVLLSWAGVTDATGVTYEIGWRVKGESSYSTSTTTSASLTLSLPDTAVYEWRLRAVDGSGKASDWVSGDTFSNDGSAPVLTLSAPAQSRLGSGSSSVTLRWSANEDVTYVLSVNGKSYTMGTSASRTLTLADGAYEYTVTATDDAGNKTSMSGSFICDTIAPTKPTSLSVKQDSRKVVLSWQPSQDANAVTYELAWRRRGESEYTTETTSLCSLSLNLSADGVYEWKLRAKDASGQLSDWVQGSSFACDVAAPVLSVEDPVMTRVSQGLTEVVIRCSANEEVSYKLVTGGRSYVSSDGTFTLRLKDGRYSYTITATDLAGNSRTRAGSFICDATAPVVKLDKPAFDKVAEGVVDVTLSWSSNELNATYTVHVDGEAKAAWSGSEPTCTLRLADGNHSYTVTATDAQGNSQVVSGSFSVDATAPTVDYLPLTTKRAGAGQTRVTLKWSGERGASYALCVDGEYVYEGKATSYTLVLGDGEHSYSVVACDAQGNVLPGEPELQSFRTDATAPGLEMEQPAVVVRKGTNGVASGVASFFWECSEAVSHSLVVDGVERLSGSGLKQSGSATVAGLGNGRHNYVLTVTDAAGNVTTQKGSFTVDARPPTLSTKAVAFTKLAGGHVAAKLSWSGEKGATFTVFTEDAAGNVSVVYRGSSTGCTLLGLADGLHRFFVTATDAAGNETTMAIKDFVYDGASLTPAVDASLSPAPVAANKLSGGKVKVSLRWKAQKGTTYFIRLCNDAEGATEEIIAVGQKGSYALSLEAGQYHYSVIGIDAQGRQCESASQALDAAAPVLDMDAPAALLNRNNYTFAWNSAGEAVSYSLKVDGKIVSESARGVDGQYILSSAAVSVQVQELLDRKHSYVLTLTDASGNITTQKGNFTVDTKAPALTLKASTWKRSAEGVAEATLSWKGERGASYSLQLLRRGSDGSLQAVSEAEGVTATSFSVDGLAGGSYVWRVQAVDAAGNLSAVQQQSFTVDATAPEFTLETAQVLAIVGNKLTTRLCWSGESGVLYTLKVNGRNALSNSSSASCDYALTSGVHSITLTAKDAAGNTLTRSYDVVVDVQAGSIALLAPSSSQELSWQSADADGVEGRVGLLESGPMAACYSFTLDAASDLLLSLDALSQDVQLTLLEDVGSGQFRAMAWAVSAASGLDRELSLSAGTHYLQVESNNSSKLSCNADFLLDLELASGSGRQAVLASSLA